MNNNEKALELVQKCLDDWPYAATRVDDIMMRLKQVKTMLKEQPEIIQCKECKHRFNGCCYNKESDKVNFGVYVADDWFCADGERKEDR